MIEVRRLNKTYDRGSRNAHHVLRDLSFTLPDTGFVCIVGESGCGKTSLLNAVGGLDKFDNGTISTERVSVSRYGSREMERERNRSFGYIFQNYYLLNEHSVAYNVYLGLHSLKLTHREKLARVREALKAVNMERYARRTVSDLSGGQQQRVAIARALARRPRVIFADEPTGNLDEENTVNICTLLRRISKTSLVVMVTHEARIARFFADRIITLSDGVITRDEDSWQRDGLSAEGESAIYAADYEEQSWEADGLHLRLLKQTGAEPVEITVAVLNDRVVIKIDDRRAVSCSRRSEAPEVREGSRPVLTLESVDNDPLYEAERAESAPAPAAPAGSGLTFGMMGREALNLLRGKGLRRLSAWIFLAAMTVLTTLMVGDYLTVSSVDPKDFVKTDSHILEIELERGPNMPLASRGGVTGKMPEFMDWLDSSGLDFDYIPGVSGELFCSVEVFAQMEGITVSMPPFSYAPLSRLGESDLIYGRMPENRNEVVIDRWVVDALLAQDGVVQNSLSDITQMLGARLSYLKKVYSPVIVGICDRGDPTLYVSDAAMVTVGVGGYNIIPLSELALERGWEVGELPELAEGECLINPEIAGQSYARKVGYPMKAANTGNFTIKDVVYCDAAMVVRDDGIDAMLRSMTQISAQFKVYCADKAAMKAWLNSEMPEGLAGQVVLKVTDANGDAWAWYTAASTMKADARTIVTVTVILLCMVMLYLLQRSTVQQRIGMMAVYRLLGIPGRKLSAIFSVESLLLSCVSVLPASAVTWAVVWVLNRLPSLEFSMVLSWQAAGLVFLVITVYHLLVSLLPVWSLLRLPPSRLAGKYDM